MRNPQPFLSTFLSTESFHLRLLVCAMSNAQAAAYYPPEGSDIVMDPSRIPSSSIKSQLATWHANRGDKSIASAIVPTWHTHSSSDEKVTKNPFKLFAMVSPFGWAMFFSSVLQTHIEHGLGADILFVSQWMACVDMRWLRLLRSLTNCHPTRRTIQGRY